MIILNINLNEKDDQILKEELKMNYNLDSTIFKNPHQKKNLNKKKVQKIKDMMRKIRINVMLKTALVIICPLSICCSQSSIREDIKELNKLNKKKQELKQTIDTENTKLIITEKNINPILAINESKSATSITPKPIIFSQLKGKLWVKECVKQHPEILCLADRDVRKTEEGQATLKGSYSKQLFGQKYIEFDRTIMTIYCLQLILDGSDKAYETFTEAQSASVKLSKESFNTLHLQGQSLLKSKWEGLSELQMAQAMETALVLGDIGKSEKARALFKPYKIEAPDHDDFHGEVMQVLKTHPEMCPSFARLPAAAKKLLVETANLAHYGHITHLEGGTEMFTGLKKNSRVLKDFTMLSFDLFVHTCDVAGALGHVDNQSSLVYTEPSHLAMQAMGDALKILSKPKKMEIDAYNAYLKVCASWLGLSSTDKYDRVLARIGAMLRLFTAEEGRVLKKAMLDLDSNTRDKIALALDIKEKESLNLRTPTYIPAVLVNLSKNSELGTSKEKRLVKAITIGLPFIARILEQHKKLVVSGKIDPKIPLCFNVAAGIAKKSPNLLSGKFKIDQKNGNVLPVTK